MGFNEPRELFLTGGKEGSTLDALLADAAVAISVALQHGVSAKALAKSAGRLPEIPIALPDMAKFAMSWPPVKGLRIRSAGPDDPIYQQGLTIYTPYTVRQRPPEPKEDEGEASGEE